MAVTIDAGPQGVRAETPHELLTGLNLAGGSKQFDFTPDGQRFLLILPSDTGAREMDRLTVELNWQARLTQ